MPDMRDTGPSLRTGCIILGIAALVIAIFAAYYLIKMGEAIGQI